MHFKKNIERGILVDPEDEILLHKYAFHVDNGYPKCKTALGNIRLHKMIKPELTKIDHANTNKLDNRRDNLREATAAQNNSNRGKQANNTSGYKGVFKNKTLWLAKIAVRGKVICLGSYITKEEAALNYDIAAKKYHKEFANLNFNLELT